VGGADIAEKRGRRGRVDDHPEFTGRIQLRRLPESPVRGRHPGLGVEQPDHLCRHHLHHRGDIGAGRYAFSRISFRGRRWLYAAIIAAIIIPPQLLIVPLFRQMLAFDLVDTYWGIILPQAFAPAMVLILKRFFDQIPVELEDAARVDGANRLRVFWSIVLPVPRPILAAVAIFVFIGAWNNFLWPFIVTTDADLMTLPVGLQTVKSAYGLQYAQNMASALLAALPLLVVFLFFQRQIIKGIATTGFGGQ
jgi:multiple sugar transport system permease protein